MSNLEKIQFVIENSSAEGAAKLINNSEQMSEVCKIQDRLWEGTTVHTTKADEAAMKGAMIVAISNGTI